MGSLYQHEKWKHGVRNTKKKARRNRKGYALRFKAEVMGTYNNLRALKCKKCTAIVVPGCYVETSTTWDEGCECGCKEYYQDVR